LNPFKGTFSLHFASFNYKIDKKPKQEGEGNENEAKFVINSHGCP
jgi:hypothetical protein